MYHHFTARQEMGVVFHHQTTKSFSQKENNLGGNVQITGLVVNNPQIK